MENEATVATDLIKCFGKAKVGPSEFSYEVNTSQRQPRISAYSYRLMGNNGMAKY
jgi:hypothetical protein